MRACWYPVRCRIGQVDVAVPVAFGTWHDLWQLGACSEDLSVGAAHVRHSVPCRIWAGMAVVWCCHWRCDGSWSEESEGQDEAAE